jgi:hypothetical protein
MTDFTLRRETAEYGTPQPTVRITGAGHHRTSKALAFRLAAKVEAGSMRDGWVVEIGESGSSDARVYLELIDGNDGEIARGMTLLESAVAELRAELAPVSLAKQIRKAPRSGAR